MRFFFILCTLWAKRAVAASNADIVAATECQDLETCPHCYNNTLPDYNPNDPSKLVVDDSLYDFMASTEQE